MELSYKFSTANKIDILNHLKRCDQYFVPILSNSVNLEEYSNKLYNKALKFEAWTNDSLIGLIAVYVSEIENNAYVSNVSVEINHQGKGISKSLFNKFEDYLHSKRVNKILLEVNQLNIKALNLYQSIGFEMDDILKDKIIMKKIIKRDYNEELKDTNDHKYAYNFDFDVMHHYMIKSFDPFFIKGNILELGSFKGDFTRKLLPYFDDITCVEASDEAVSIAKSEFGNGVHFINDLFENVKLPKKYDNIVLTHVLEHIDDPVSVLKRINDEWLSDRGRFFLVCPNANAPSRQIAVKMGLISHNTAVTPSEKEHGHNITYTLDTLERDARAAGLKVVFRTGIFFKALANFQWDRLLNTDIISKDYLEGCYQLGHQYPDLCSSIFIMCEKGK